VVRAMKLGQMLIGVGQQKVEGMIAWPCTHLFLSQLGGPCECAFGLVVTAGGAQHHAVIKLRQCQFGDDQVLRVKDLVAVQIKISFV